MDYFRMSQDKQYVIYGAGGDCRHIVEVLTKNNMHIVAIIDKRADSIGKLEDIPVYKLEEFDFSSCADYIFIISIKNVFEHTAIAKELLVKGARNLVYKPLPTLNGADDDEWNSNSMAYDSVLTEKIIPEIDIAMARENHMMEYKARLLIGENNGKVLCLLPIELIHNYFSDDAFGKMHMASYYPLVDLYKYLLGVMTHNTWDEIKEQYYLYAAEWVNRVGESYTPELKKSMIHSRVGAFEEMQKIADIDKDFFKKNAVDVEIGKYKQFYLKSSGRNRVAFLVAKGNNYVPVRMDKASYEKWLAPEKTKEIVDYLEKNRINMFYSKIPHPVFSSFPAEAFDYSRLFCMQVISRMNLYLHKSSISHNSEYPKVDYNKYLQIKNNILVFCDIEDMGILGRYITAAGIRCTHLPGKNEELVLMLDKLFDYDDKGLLDRKEFFLTEKPDVYITDFLHPENYKRGFGANTIFAILDEDEGQAEEKLIKEGFVKKTVFFETFWNEKKVAGVEWTK